MEFRFTARAAPADHVNTWVENLNLRTGSAGLSSHLSSHLWARQSDSKPSARHRQAQLLDALAQLQEAVEAQTPQDADLIYEALNGAYETSRGRRLER